MFILILSWFKNFTSSYGSELDKFITSRNPQSTSEVEALEREYNRINSRQGFVL